MEVQLRDDEKEHIENQLKHSLKLYEDTDIYKEYWLGKTLGICEMIEFLGIDINTIEIRDKLVSSTL